MRFNVDFDFSVQLTGERGWGKMEREYGILYLIRVRGEVAVGRAEEREGQTEKLE